MKILLSVIFLFVSFEVFANVVNVSKNGSISYTRQSTSHWDSKSWSKSAISDSYYRKVQIDAMRARYEGQLSNQTFSGVLNNSVSRKAVLAGSFNLVKRGAAALVGGGGIPGAILGGAMIAAEAYNAVKGDLESQGYHYEGGEFVKRFDNALCLYERKGDKKVYLDCLELDSSLLRAFNLGGKSQEEAKWLIKTRGEAIARPYFEDLKSRDNWYKGYVFKECIVGSITLSCTIDKDGDIRRIIFFDTVNNKTPITLTEKQFLDLATGSIDSNPTPFVEGTGRPEYQEDVSVESGTVVTIGPVTTNEGPVQITITFTQNNGQTTTNVNITPRNDLTPNSPTAPSTGSSTGGDTGGQTGNNTSGQTGNDTGNQTGNQNTNQNQNNTDRTTRTEVKPKTGEGGQTDTKTKPNEGDKTKEGDKTEQPQGGLLCEIFPNILACDELPEKEEPDLQIPEETINLNFSPENVFSEVGECPAPVTFQAMGATYAISLVPACTLAEMMRPFIIAMAWLVAAFFVARTVRNSV